MNKKLLSVGLGLLTISLSLPIFTQAVSAQAAVSIKPISTNLASAMSKEESLTPKEPGLKVKSNLALALDSKYYGAAVKYLLSNPSLREQVIKTAWNEGGKGIAAQKMKEALDGKRISKGVNVHHVNVNLGEVSYQRAYALGDQSSVVVDISGNDIEFKTTTNTIFGGYADPSFRTGFKLRFRLYVSALTNQIRVDDVAINISDANVHGSNLTGTIIETVGDLFTKGEFSRDMLSQINGDYSAKEYLAGYIKSAIDRLVPSNVLSPPAKALGRVKPSTTVNKKNIREILLDPGSSIVKPSTTINGENIESTRKNLQ